MRNIAIFLTMLLIPSLCFGYTTERVQGFDEDRDLPVLNEILREIRDNLYLVKTSATDAPGYAESTSPGGSDSYVQYNDGGEFGGEAELFWDDSNNTLYSGQIKVGVGSGGIVGNGYSYGHIYQSSSDIYIKNLANNADIVFTGADGGQAWTGLRVDMSESAVLVGSRSPGDVSFGLGVFGKIDCDITEGSTGLTLKAHTDTESDGPEFHFKRGEKDATDGAPITTTDNDNIGTIRWYGTDDYTSVPELATGTYAECGRIEVLQNGAATTTNVPAEMLFSLDTGSGMVELFALDTDGMARAAAGIIIGTDTADSWIDDSTQGSGSTTLYLGNETIDTTAVSDRRMKENITETKYGLKNVLQMNVVDFNFKKEYTDDDNEHTGLIAQELKEIYPEAVELREDGLYMINYKTLVPVLIRSIQELEARVAELEKEKQ